MLPIQWNLSWETTAMRNHPFWATTHFQGPTFKMTEPVTRDHLSWKTTFLWPAGWSFKTGTTAYYLGLGERLLHVVKEASEILFTVQHHQEYTEIPTNIVNVVEKILTKVISHSLCIFCFYFPIDMKHAITDSNNSMSETWPFRSHLYQWLKCSKSVNISNLLWI